MRRNFFLGVAAALSLVMAVQDFMGLEAYIQYCRDNWIDFPWWVGGGLCLFFTVWASIFED